MFIAALFTVVLVWEQTEYLSKMSGLKKCDVTHIGKYYLAIRKTKKVFHLWQHG